MEHRWLKWEEDPVVFLGQISVEELVGFITIEEEGSQSAASLCRLRRRAEGGGSRALPRDDLSTVGSHRHERGSSSKYSGFFKAQ